MKINVRLARPEEYDEIAEVGAKAMVSDPFHLYIGNCTQPTTFPSRQTANSKALILFCLKSCIQNGGICTVVDSSSFSDHDDSQKPVICAFMFFYPPGRRRTDWNIYSLFKAGLGKAMKKFGVYSIVSKVVIEYEGKAHRQLEAAYRGTGQSPESSWYIWTVATDPEFQGKGLLGHLMRDVYSRAKPGESLYLESSTPNSRDRYAHLGFELCSSPRLGVGKVNELGLQCKGKKDAKGFPLFVMVNWKPKDHLS